MEQTQTKTCFKCNRLLVLDEFYAHPEMKDGHLNKCKDCTRLDVSEHRKMNLEKIRAYDRNRRRGGKDKKHVDRMKRYSEEHKEELREYKKLYSRDRKKKKANTVVGNAVRDGRLSRPVKCEWCRQELKLQGHHTDYTKPLDVVWLCTKCHGRAHWKRDAV